MNELISRRGQLKGQLNRLATYLRENTISVEQIDVDQIRIRAEKARETWNDFQQIQAQIEELDITAETESYRVDFEDLFYKNLALCDKFLREVGPALSNTSTESNVNHGGSSSAQSAFASKYVSDSQPVQSVIKLAALQIPTFSGVYTEWATFYDIFFALVHGNTSLSEVQKFFYLRSVLTGDAENVIKCLRTTSDNYQVAWESLVAHYNNKRVLVQVHIQSLFDLEPVKKETSLQRRKLVDDLTGHLKALDSLGQNPDNWGSLLLHLITSKLDSNTMREWETISSKTEVPAVNSLINFLQSSFRVLEAVEASKLINASQDNSRKTVLITKKSYNKSSTFAATSEVKCFVCKKAHTIYHCPSFLGLSINDRIKKVTELKLCLEIMRLEETRETNVHTLEERMCTQHFEKSVRRDDNGRFIVTLPFRDALKLGYSYELALKDF